MPHRSRNCVPSPRDVTVSRAAVIPDTGHAGVGAVIALRRRVRCGAPRHGRATDLRRVWLALVLSCAAHAALAVECRPQGTRFERNYCAAVDAHTAELALVAARERMRDALAADAHALAAFERANRAWADYVDATLATAHPCAHDDLTLCYGKGTAACVARLRARLADERRALLEDLLARPPGPEDCE